MTHLRSEQDLMGITSFVFKCKDHYYGEKAIHVEPISIGGKRAHTHHGVMYLNAKSAYLVVYLTDVLEDRTCRWEIVQSVDMAQVSEINTLFLLKNISKWLVPLGSLLSEPEETNPIYKLGRIAPILENPISKAGTYVALTQYKNKIRWAVEINNIKELYEVIDKFHIIPSNLNVEELYRLGYLKLSNCTSWLGVEGSHIHAAIGYHRKLKDGSNIFFSLETWCGKSHWKSKEHSPVLQDPTADNVTCSKCLYIIHKREKESRKVLQFPLTKRIEVPTNLKELSDEAIFDLAALLGVTWKENPHKGINRMRAVMAIKAKSDE